MGKDSIVIVSAARTPLGNFSGALKQVSAPALGAEVIRAVLTRAGLPPEKTGEVLMGCVLPAGLGQAPARQAALKAGLPAEVPCTTINKVCGSAMKAIMIAHDALTAHSTDVIVAGGMESMTRSPYLLNGARAGYRIGHHEVIDHMMRDGLEDAGSGKPMGFFAEQCASAYGFTRAAQDQFALASLERARNAIRDGKFAAEIIPVDNVVTDERPGAVQPEKIPQLKPAFAPDGTVTAANSSSISDGAAAVLLMREDTARSLGLTPLARIIAHTSHANTPDTFTTAPIGAIQKLLAKTGWSIDSIDLFEINEAFAVVAMAAMQSLDIPHSKLNVHGGACALGHPIGASGARIVVTLLYALQQAGLKRGVASLCIGGGEATALAIELA